jgi:predicted enzyme related to lactoylglutathione lyase
VGDREPDLVDVAEHREHRLGAVLADAGEARSQPVGAGGRERRRLAPDPARRGLIARRGGGRQQGLEELGGVGHRREASLGPVAERARLIGINHVALEVDDVDEALEFYGRLFEVELRSHMGRMAFIEMGDQFLAVASGRRQGPDDQRHFGLVVDDVDAVRAALAAAGVEEIPTPFDKSVDFQDPWGNHFQVVAYPEVQFERTPGVKRALGIEGLEKSEDARREIAEKGLD